MDWVADPLTWQLPGRKGLQLHDAGSQGRGLNGLWRGQARREAFFMFPMRLTGL